MIYLPVAEHSGPVQMPDLRRPARPRSYAPFCKHLFVPCFLPDATVEAVPITPENRHLLRSDYEVPRNPPPLARRRTCAPLAS
jgi:hypothetical protein